MFVCMAMGRFSYTAMVPALVNSGQFSAEIAGFIGGSNLVGALLGALLTTSLPASYRVSVVIRIALWIAVLGLFASALSFGPLWLGFWRFVIGISTGIVMVLGLSLSTNSAPAQYRAKAASFVFIGVGLGILYSAAAVPFFLHFGLIWAWISIAIAGLIAGLVSWWAWNGLNPNLPRFDHQKVSSRNSITLALWLLYSASFLFSFGIVPHTLFWVDYIARELFLGQEIASLHWLLVGVFAIVGPIAAASLSTLFGTGSALVLTLLILGIGIGLPYADASAFSLVLSTILFGMQPAVSTLFAARLRDLSDDLAIQKLMRNLILANGMGSATGGIILTNLFAAYQNYELIFLSGALAFLLGALCSLPILVRSSKKFI